MSMIQLIYLLIDSEMREKIYEDWYNKEYQDLQEDFKRDTQQDYMNNTWYYPTDEVMDECERNLFRTWCKKNNYQPIF